MHNYNSPRKEKKASVYVLTWRLDAPISQTFLSFILCCWIFFAAENFHLTLQYLKTIIKRKLLLSKCTLPLFYHFFFIFIFWVTLVVPLYLLQHLSYPIFNFNLTVVGHHIHRELLIIWVLISSVLHELLSHDKIAKYHVKIFKTNLNEFSL